MPYDDDDHAGLRDWRDVEEVLRRFFSTPDNLTLGRLRGVLREMAELIIDGERDVSQLSFHDVHATLQRHKLGGMTADAVVELLDALVPYLQDTSSAEEAIGKLTLKDLETILARVQDSH